MFGKTKIYIGSLILVLIFLLSSCGGAKKEDIIDKDNTEIETQTQEELPELESSDFGGGGDGEEQTSSRNY